MGVRHILVIAFLLTVAANEKYHFWYIYATNGNYGILLDMIVRPSNAAIRAAIYNANSHVQPVFWDFYSLDQVNFTGDSVFIGKNQLTPELINIVVHNVSIVGQFFTRTNDNAFYAELGRKGSALHFTQNSNFKITIRYNPSTCSP